MFTRSTRCLAAAAFALMGAVATQAASPFETISGLVAAGRYDDARAAAAAISDTPDIAEANAKFAEALILRHQGKLAEAAALMREIINAHPGFARVRHELAATLAEDEDWDGAAYHLDFLAHSVTDQQLRSTYQGYLDAVTARRPWQFSASFGVLPSTNINNASSGKVIVVGGVPLVPTETAQSGVGATGSGSGSYAFTIDDATRFTVGASASGKVYEDHSFDQLVVGSFAELARVSGNWRFGGGAVVERTLDGWQGYRTSYGPVASVSYSFGQAGQVTLTGAVRRHDFDAGYSEADYRSGLTYSFPFSATTVVSAGVEVNRYAGNAPFNSHLGVRPSLGVSTELPMGLIVSARLSYLLRDFDTAIPLVGTERDEGAFEASAGVTFRGLSVAGFAPRVEYTYFNSDSQTDLFDTESHTLGVTMAKVF